MAANRFRVCHRCVLLILFLVERVYIGNGQHFCTKNVKTSYELQIYGTNSAKKIRCKKNRQQEGAWSFHLKQRCQRAPAIFYRIGLPVYIVFRLAHRTESAKRKIPLNGIVVRNQIR